MINGKEVYIDYTNYRGERSVRFVRPSEIWFGSTEFHPIAQWLLRAYDLDKDAERDFAFLDIHQWVSDPSELT